MNMMNSNVITIKNRETMDAPSAIIFNFDRRLSPTSVIWQPETIREFKKTYALASISQKYVSKIVLEGIQDTDQSIRNKFQHNCWLPESYAPDMTDYFCRQLKLEDGYDDFIVSIEDAKKLLKRFPCGRGLKAAVTKAVTKTVEEFDRIYRIREVQQRLYWKEKADAIMAQLGL